VDACHGLGIGVVMDVVYNHLGPVGNHLGRFGPYFTDRHRTPWGDAVSFDGPDSDEVRRFVTDNAVHWLRDHHCDGLRLDAVHAILDDSALHILEEIGGAVEALGAHLRKPLFVIAESDLNDPRLVRSREAGGFGLDAAWADDWHHAVHVALTGETDGYYADFTDADALPTALEQAWVLDGRWSRSRQRQHGRPPADLPPSRFVVCTQNHDQTGNRAIGERSAALMSEDRLRVAAALLLTSPFVPLLFQGEEWAAATPFQYFTDHDDPDLAEAVRAGRRSEFAAFGWDPDRIPDPQDPATFERSRLDWSSCSTPGHRRVLDWYRSLIALRRRVPELTDPRLPVSAQVDDGLVLTRRGRLCLAANLGPSARAVQPAPGSEILARSPDEPDPGVEGVVLPVDSVVIWIEPGR
jgi:maltooligosyltrehalose trehalohydrolase